MRTLSRLLPLVFLLALVLPAPADVAQAELQTAIDRVRQRILADDR